MKGCSWGLGFAATLLISIPAAQADVSFYATGAIGAISTDEFEDTINDGYPFADSVLGIDTGAGIINIAAPPLEADDYNVAGNVFVGMRFNPYIAAELMYVSYGEFSADFNQTLVFVDGNGIPVDTLPVRLSGNMDVSGFGLGARLDLPLTAAVGVYGRAGVYEWRQKISYSGNVIEMLTSSTSTPTNTLQSDTLSDFDFYAGLGATFKVYQQTSLLVELNMAEMGEDEFSMTPFGIFFGVQYDFAGTGFGPDQTTNTKRASKNETRALTVCDPKYKDIAGSACD